MDLSRYVGHFRSPFSKKMFISITEKKISKKNRKRPSDNASHILPTIFANISAVDPLLTQQRRISLKGSGYTNHTLISGKGIVSKKHQALFFL